MSSWSLTWVRACHSGSRFLLKTRPKPDKRKNRPSKRGACREDVTGRPPRFLLFHRLTHSDELFRRRRMNTKGGIKLRLRRPRLDRNRQALGDLTCIRANHVCTQDFVCLVVNHQLHQAAFITAAQGVLHWPELGAINAQVVPCLPRFLFG